MAKAPQSLEEYYAIHSFAAPVDIKKSTGHFNVLCLDKHLPEESKPVPFGRKDFFKICLISGNSTIHYADKSIEISGKALFFGNPLIPYNWEYLNSQSGFTCVFDEAFFQDFGRIKEYPVFQPAGHPVYELSLESFAHFESIFKGMEAEKNSDFDFRNDVLRNQVFQIIHAALKMRPAPFTTPAPATAGARIARLFLELLERQFPVGGAHADAPLRSPSEYASQLAIHVNHLNKSVKEALQKTTSEVIMERLMKEAKILLKHSSWSISEIAYSLGFEGPTHFGTFFKKQLQLTPTEFRKMGMRTITTSI
ncbi:AraC-type DNA-binding protein [Cnuella takakiae]|uniref:AraC-type DNA-binding protein n=1 Tax=Cnuella takakiae TaxID=1302690 RepID=A0A1M4Z222_9BACT|nr:AraC family transcriptional regulator [Cnuella takakiae]OLY95024.1 hypothetical protein BUE76_22550 [Cnuella takakiae]SHF12123.1 AraC-type DNA-binding protein [Cnuella takakiae]